jgi:hypothetical protein
MSSDNGVYILKTKVSKPHLEDSPELFENRGPCFEYRVLHTSCIENIYWDPELGEHREDQNFTPEIAFQYFGQAPVFSQEEEAFAEASRIASDISILEYGISLLEHGTQVFETFSPEEILEFTDMEEAFSTRRRVERQARLEAELKRNTLQLPALAGVMLTSGVVEIPSPDWKEGDPEALRVIRARISGTVRVQLLEGTPVIRLE